MFWTVSFLDHIPTKNSPITTRHVVNQMNEYRERAPDPPVFDVEQYSKVLAEIGYHVFETYVNARIDWNNGSLEDELVIEIKDQEMYDDQLISLSNLARLNPGHSVALLNRLLVERIQLFQDGLGKYKTGQIQETYLHSLFDHMHWIILIAGYLMGDAGTGEKPIIPSVFLKSNDVPHPVAQFLTNVLHLLDFTSRASATEDMDVMSPLVAETLFWFLERWSKSYLFADADVDYVDRFPASMKESFGQKSLAAHQMVEFILDKIQANLMLWSGEVEVTLAAVKLLDSFSRDSTTRSALMHMPKWKLLVHFLLEHLSALPGESHSPLMAALASVGSGAKDEQEMKHYFDSILGTVEVSQ